MDLHRLELCGFLYLWRCWLPCLNARFWVAVWYQCLLRMSYFEKSMLNSSGCWNSYSILWEEFFVLPEPKWSDCLSLEMKTTQLTDPVPAEWIRVSLAIISQNRLVTSKCLHIYGKVGKKHTHRANQIAQILTFLLLPVLVFLECIFNLLSFFSLVCNCCYILT